MSSNGPNRRGLLLVVSAPSGTGKTTVVERLVQVTPDLALSRSYTSRSIRAGETDGIDYNFITRTRFEDMVARGRLSRVGGRLRQPVRHVRRGCRARAGGGPRPGARHRRPGRAAGAARGVRARSACSCCRLPTMCSSGACAAGARTRKRPCSGACGPRGTKSRRLSSTTTSSSTTSSTRASSACAPC